MNDINLVGNSSQGVPVHEDAIRHDAGIFDCRCHRAPQAGRHPPVVNVRGWDIRDADGKRDFGYASRHELASRRRELLGIVQPRYTGLIGEADGANGERSRNGAASDLVHPDDDASSPVFPHSAIHRIDPLALG